MTDQIQDQVWISSQQRPVRPVRNKENGQAEDVPPSNEELPKYTLVEDVDTGPDVTTQETSTSHRFNLDEDTLGPGQTLHEEKVDPIAIDFGDPGPTEWFRIDPRLDRTVPVVMAKLTPPGSDRDKLYYVPKSARDIPELKPYLRSYALHVIQKLVGPLMARTQSGRAVCPTYQRAAGKTDGVPPTPWWPNAP